MGTTTQINNFNKNRWAVRFSNFPNMTGVKELDMHVMNDYVKSFNVPEFIDGRVELPKEAGNLFYSEE